MTRNKATNELEKKYFALIEGIGYNLKECFRFHSSVGRALPRQGRGRWFEPSWDHNRFYFKGLDGLNRLVFFCL